MRRLLFVVAAAAALWLAPGAFAAGWCGGGESGADRPDLTTGRQIHAVVVEPSDVPDSFATVAGRLADDVASMGAWWTGQDATRAPRFDQATFGASACLDISYVRLTEASASLVGASASFTKVATELFDDGFANLFKKYLVYYDGPAVENGVCGTGGGEFGGGPSYAVVWLQGCGDVPSDGVATHELLHALGALPAGAPHACPGDASHPCDSPTDVLYPTTSGAPLAQQVLDFNHDDYYAHSGSWVDIQDSGWLAHLDTPQVALGVSFSGAGTVQSDLPGIDCSAACTTTWDSGTTLALTALPAATTRFVRWSGGCSGSDDCALALSGATSVTAIFGPLRVPIRVATAGKGKVACSPACSKAFGAGNPLTLRAVPAKGWKFFRWSGACKGSRPVCRPATDFAVAARAVFTKKR